MQHIPAWEHVGWDSTVLRDGQILWAKAMETAEPSATESGLDGGCKTKRKAYMWCIHHTNMCIFSTGRLPWIIELPDKWGQITCSWVAQHVDTASSLHITWFVGYHKHFTPRMSQDSLEDVYRIPWVGYVIFCSWSVDDCGYLRHLERLELLFENPGNDYNNCYYWGAAFQATSTRSLALHCL